MSAPSTYEQLADLPLHIDGYALDGLSRRVSSGFRRFTTVFRVAGAGHEGLGEDVTYEAAEQLGIDTPVETIHDYAEMARLGIMSTPALAVDGRVIMAGNVPSVEVVRRLLSGVTA